MAWWKICVVTGGYVLLLIIRRIRRQKRLCKSPETLEGKTAIITGANCGIGQEAALEMARRNARVILACRDVGRGEDAVEYIRKHTKNGELLVRKLDLGSLASVRAFCRQILDEERRIDVLVNNAGVYLNDYSKTEDGFEMNMGVNHFGHFLLTNLLLDRLKQSAPSRIIVVTSGLHKGGTIKFDDINSERSYDKKKGYSNSKLANCLFVRELSQRLRDTGVNVYCISPGFCATNLGRYVMNRFISKLVVPIVVLLGMRTSEEGCQTIIYCAVASELADVTDGYFASCKQEPWSEPASDLTAANKLWKLSEKMTGLSS